MTEETVYDCQICGETLERAEQGRYLWCPRCRRLWDDGFNRGLTCFKRFCEVRTKDELVELVGKEAPYSVKQRFGEYGVWKRVEGR